MCYGVCVCVCVSQIRQIAVETCRSTSREHTVDLLNFDVRWHHDSVRLCSHVINIP